MSVLFCPVCDVGVLWPNGWTDHDETWLQVGLGPGHIVLDADPAPPPQKGHSPQFSANIHCGQTAGWTKMPLGTEEKRRPRRCCVRCCRSSPKRGTALQFSVHVYCGQNEVDLGAGHILLYGIPALREMVTAALSFRPMSIVGTNSHLSYC